MVRLLLTHCAPGTTVVALGDGRADEGVFAVLPPDGVAIHVGPEPSRAPFRLANVREVRRFLASLIPRGDRA